MPRINLNGRRKCGEKMIVPSQIPSNERGTGAEVGKREEKDKNCRENAFSVFLLKLDGKNKLSLSEAKRKSICNREKWLSFNSFESDRRPAFFSPSWKKGAFEKDSLFLNKNNTFNFAETNSRGRRSHLSLEVISNTSRGKLLWFIFRGRVRPVVIRYSRTMNIRPGDICESQCGNFFVRAFGKRNVTQSNEKICGYNMISPVGYFYCYSVRECCFITQFMRKRVWQGMCFKGFI